MGEFRDRGGEAVWAGIEQKSQYGAENKRRRDTAASRRLVTMSIGNLHKNGAAPGIFLCILLNFIFGALHKFDIILKENFVKNADFYFIFSTLHKI